MIVRVNKYSLSLSQLMEKIIMIKRSSYRRLTLEQRIARLEHMIINKRYDNVHESYDELYRNMSRDIKSIYIELYRKGLSADEIEDRANERNTSTLDKVISLLIRESGYSSDDIEEYGIRDIKELLSDFATEGYDNVILD